jgi:hypothetical protein
MNRIAVIVSTLNEENEEVKHIVKRCKDEKIAEQYVAAHEQDFADNPSIYAVYIQAINIKRGI